METNIKRKNLKDFNSIIKEKNIKESDVLVALKGFNREYLIITNNDLIISKKGFLTNNAFGGNDFHVPINKIANINIKKKFLDCYLDVYVPGIISHNNKHVKQSDLPNSINFMKSETTLFNDARNICLNLIQNKSNSEKNDIVPQMANAEKAQTTNLQQIKELKELLDIGAITNEEFDAKKTVLLNKIGEN